MGAGILIWAVLVLLQTQPVWALDCPQPTQFYNNWESERLYKEPSVFSAFGGLAWGTEVCPLQETEEHWLRTWHRVQLPNGTTGWVVQDDLITQTAFGESLSDRHAAKVAELNALLIEVRELEGRLQDVGMAVPLPDLHTVIIAWVQASAGPMGLPAAEATPEPRPTLAPTATPIPVVVPETDGPCDTSEVQAYLTTARGYLDTSVAAKQTIDGLLVQLIDNPALIADPQWNYDFIIHQTILQEVQSQVEDLSLTDPRSMNRAHGHLMTATRYYRRGADTIVEALDTSDQELAARGDRYMQDAAFFVREFEAALLTACE